MKYLPLPGMCSASLKCKDLPKSINKELWVNYDFILQTYIAEDNIEQIPNHDRIREPEVHLLEEFCKLHQLLQPGIC